MPSGTVTLIKLGCVVAIGCSEMGFLVGLPAAGVLVDAAGKSFAAPSDHLHVNNDDFHEPEKREAHTHRGAPLQHSFGWHRNRKNNQMYTVPYINTMPSYPPNANHNTIWPAFTPFVHGETKLFPDVSYAMIPRTVTIEPTTSND